MQPTEVAESELRLKADQAIKEMNSLTTAAKGFATQLEDILQHLDDLNNKSLSKIKKQVNKYDLGSASNIAIGTAGTMTSQSGKGKVFREYEQAMVDQTNAQTELTKEIKRDTAQRRKLRKQNADTEKQRVSKMEDKTSSTYIENKTKIADAEMLKAQARMLNAQNSGAGALNRNWKYQLGKGAQTLGQTVSGFGVGGRLIGLGLDTAGALLKAPALGATTAITNLAKGISDLGKEAVQSFSEIESIRTQLGVVFSNQTQANTMFGEISQYAVKSPFGVQQTSELAVLLKQSGVYASDLMNTLRMIGDTAGGNMEKMKRIANNYAQIVSIGKASMLDMRQFAYAGIPIFEAVSKELGVSQQELRKLISDGKVTSDIIEKVFKDLTGINGIFENATEKGAKTLKARLQNLSDAKQLAFASGGEWLTKLGTQTGNDSYTNAIVSWLEQIYQDIHDTIDTRNIEKSVKAIEERENRIKQYQDLIDKYADNPRMAAIFAQALGVELDKRSKEQDRATYESSYQSKTKLPESTYKQWGVSNFEELKQLADIISITGRNQYRGGKSSVTAGGVMSSVNYAESLEFARSKGYNIEELYNMGDSDFKVLADSINNAVKAINNLKAVTDIEIQYHLESNLLQAQQLAFDQQNSRANKTGSLNSAFQELLELQKSDPEYKKKQEEEHIKTLKGAQAELKKLVDKADKNGNLDITKFSIADYTKYNALGAFAPGRKLNVVNGDGTANREDVALLKTQFNHFMNEGLKTIGLTDNKTAAALTKEMATLNGNLSDTDYLEKFSVVLNNVKNILEGSSLPESVRKSIYESILGSTYTHELTTGGQNVDISKLLGGDNFVPLWKRILAGATGLSTQGMTGTIQTMQNYRDDMAIRNMTSNVLSATMKSMGIDSAMSLIKTAGNQKILRGDTGATFQVDWQATRKAIKEFSLSLSASTEVITAYKNSLQQELDTYEQLIAAGYTQGESQDLKNQKTVSTKTLAKLSQDAGDQLVNAFGEGLKTASGKTAFFNGTEFVDSEGNKLLEEEIVMTGNLFEFIKGELPRIYNELHEANVTEKQNAILDKMFQNISGTWAKGTIAGLDVSSQVKSFLLDNPDYLTDTMQSGLTANKNAQFWNSKEKRWDPVWRNLQNKSNTDILLLAEAHKNGTDQSLVAEDAYRLINVILHDIEQTAKGFVNSPLYKELFDKNYTKERDEAVLAAYYKNKQINEYGLADPNSLKARDYGGVRGIRNWMQELFTGESLAYDKEDFIATTLKANPAKFGLTEESLKTADGLEKSNEALASMLSLSQQIMIIWDKGANDIAIRMDDLAHSVGQTLSQFLSSSVTSTFETWGEALGKGADASEELESNFKKLGAGLLSNLGTMITEAGLSMAIHASSMPGVIAGLGLAAAGGAASWLGGYLNAEKDSKDSTKDETAKLESLKKDLQDLLAQARTDALYYENNLRHKNALGINRQFSEKSVHDAVITPKGDVVTTDPKDYLIATKQPQNLIGGGNVTVQPIINNTVVNNTSARVRQEQTQNADGSIDILTIIEDTVGQYIASSKSDAAFEARDYRRNGRQAVM